MINVRENIDFKILEKFSSYSKLIRFFCIMSKFKEYICKKGNKKGNRITYRDIHETELKFLKQLQKDMFLPKDPRLENLQVFIHTDGLLR